MDAIADNLLHPCLRLAEGIFVEGPGGAYILREGVLEEVEATLFYHSQDPTLPGVLLALIRVTALWTRDPDRAVPATALLLWLVQVGSQIPQIQYLLAAATATNQERVEDEWAELLGRV